MKSEKIKMGFEFTYETIRELSCGKGEEDGVFEQSAGELCETVTE